MGTIIFDMDGVLVESMPLHYQAMKIAIEEIASIDLDKREFYLLEGMPIAEMTLEILKIKGYVDAKNITKKDIQISENVAKRKKEVFREINVMPKPFAGVRELITNTLSRCKKAVVSGSSKEEVDIIINGIFGADAFNIIIDGDQFEGKGKPDPASYEVALQRLNTEPSEAVIVENAPLGVQAANNADIPCMVSYQKTVCLEIRCQLETFYITGVTISLKVMCSAERLRYLNTCNVHNSSTTHPLEMLIISLNTNSQELFWMSTLICSE